MKWETRATAIGIAGLLAAQAVQAAELKIVLPLGRVAYQTNERVDLDVLRSDTQALPAGTLTLAVDGPDGSRLAFAFPVAAVPVAGANAAATEHCRLDGRLLRPGAYTVSAAADGAAAEAKFELFGHIRKSSFRIVDWGSRAGAADFPRMGEDSLGFNTVLGDFRLGRMANVEGAVRGGLDYMQVCTMSGAHQMDLRVECDWSDPYVLGGGVARGVQQAFISRTTPNCLGVHFYDEPGLTWEGAAGPMGVTAQHRSYRSAFGRDVPPFAGVKPDDPAFRDAWAQWHNWHEGFMDAAWKHSAFGVTCVRPDLLPITQSVYGFTAYADGYYFNVVRSLPLISGHGGYSDGQTGFYYPAWHMEYGRMRDWNKPYWYLPSWYHMSSDQYRVEQYMSFMNNIQGMMKPPDHQVHNPAGCAEADGIVEANKLQMRLGTIFNTMPVTRPPVAVLYSMSQLLDGELRGFAASPTNTGAWAYEGGGHSRAASLMTYVASKALHIPFFPVVEEDILDGTLAHNHKVLVVPGVHALEPKTVSALAGFISGGGVVLVSDDSRVEIPHALKIGAPLPIDFYNATGALWQKDQKQYWIRASAAHYRKALQPFIDALGAQLKQARIAPALECDNPGVLVSRQAEGDIEYLFAVNGCNDMETNMNATIATEATLGVADDGRPVYDAVRGGELALFKKDGGLLRATLRFGPGQLRVFARSARPIGGVICLPPVQFCDYAAPGSPLHVSLGAVLVDSSQRVLSGSVPLAITITDPLGAVRYDLYRATERGTLKLELPLAANDPAGEWKVSVRELLTGKEDAAAFAFAPAASCGALAGRVARAVVFGEDRANIFRFFQFHKDVTLVVGAGDCSKAAADRLAGVLAPWGVRCKTVSAADANTPRQIPEEARRTWCGLDPGRPDFKNPGVSQVGFAVDGPAILLGTPEDNPLIGFAQSKGFLPYKAQKDLFPGRGRGYLAWQAAAVGYFNQESVTLIADDQAGMDEAVGTLYEICAGVDPLMPLDPPAVAEVAPAAAAGPSIPAPALRWRALAPDRVVGLQAGADAITAIAHDGTELTLRAAGEVKSARVLAAAEAAQRARAMAASLDADLVKKVSAPALIAKMTQPLDGGLTAIGYWGGMLKIVDGDGSVKRQQLLAQDVTALAAAGGQLLVGLSDGQVLCFTAPAK